MDDDAVWNGLHNLDEHLTNLSFQLDCARRMQTIEKDLHDLRANAVKACSAGGEDGYVGDMASKVLDAISEYFEEIYPFEYATPVLMNLLISLRDLQREAREAARTSFLCSRDQIVESCRSVEKRLYEMSHSMRGEVERLSELGKAREAEGVGTGDVQEVRARLLPEQPRWLWEMKHHAGASAAHDDRNSLEKNDDHG
jgi:hypothetical protein